jgi:hypothetical protein
MINSTAKLTAAQLKDLKGQVRFTIGDTGVGTQEQARWVIRSEKVYKDVTAQLKAGTSKRNTALLGEVVEALDSLNKSIVRISNWVCRELEAKNQESYYQDAKVIDFETFASRKKMG